MGRAFADLSSPKILLIDDHEMIISGFKALCASLDKPILVVSATSLEEGISVFGRTQGIDLCLLDLGMPGLSGIEAFVQFKRACPQARVAVYSANGNHVLQAEIIQHGAVGFVSKGLPLSKLTDALHHILEGGIYIPMEIGRAHV